VSAELDLAAELLGQLVEEVVFLGGATIGVWITDPAAPPVRVTKDVDAIVEATYSQLEDFAVRLRARGFRNDPAVICRYAHGAGVVLDVMPVDTAVLGFSNRWYPQAMAHAESVELPSGRRIRVAAPAWLVATKVEAYLGRGGNDPLSSADFEDLVRLVDGRPDLADEADEAPEELRGFLAATLSALAARRDFSEVVEGCLPVEPGSRARAAIVVDRWNRMAERLGNRRRHTPE
jgi:hypothetical protein